MNQNNSTLHADIMFIIRANNNRIKRFDLLEKLWARGYFATETKDTADRIMRDVCAKELPICPSDKGYYIPKTKDELLACKKYLEKKAIPLFVRWNFIRNSYPDLLEPGQMELFEG